MAKPKLNKTQIEEIKIRYQQWLKLKQEKGKAYADLWLAGLPAVNPIKRIYE